MVQGLDVKHSVLLIPVTLFCYLTAILNPIISLECTQPNCRKAMRSEYDDDFGDYDSYDDWRNGTANLQSDGNVTLIKFKHGYVKCNSDCDDCEGKDDASESCDDYNDTEYELLLVDLENLAATETDYNYTLPSYLVPDCSCRDWCSACDGDDLVSLPGDEGYHRHMQNYWHKLEQSCEEWQIEFGTDGNEMCDLFQNFYFTMSLTLLAFGWLLGVLALLMFMEYTNFHIFYNGRCKCCFISPKVKKALFTVLLVAPVLFMLYVQLNLVLGNTTEMLDKYFDLVGADFEYDWITRGFVMFWISIGLGIISVVVMMLSGTTERHLRTVVNYRRGVEYEGVNWKPHLS